MNVLIVEADPANSSTLREVLKERAYDVTACTTVAEAMKVFRETVFQLLFVDLCLPGMDGFSFCRWVRDQAAGDQPAILANTTNDGAADSRLAFNSCRWQ
jgi:DNA-binding response OmpR family regulator